MSNPNIKDFGWKKGQSGNPGGRPKKDWTWSGLLEQIANEVEPKSGKQFKELVSRRLWVDAVNGNLGAQKEIINRMDGLPMQRQEISGVDGDKLEVVIVSEHKK